MKRILTGLQPTGTITLGNYIGAIKQMETLQNEFESYIFIADLHSITIKQDPKELKNNIKNLIALYLACGIDPDKNTIYLQSDINYIPAISWLLECNTGYGDLLRMTQFKDKSQKKIVVSAGLLTYPVLMAADILAMDANLVPVGIDQKQHLELTRNIAEHFNKTYGKVFTVPQPYISRTGTKIMDLSDPTKKMSKSAENPKGVIYLLDDEATVRKKIMSATTDSDMQVKYDEENKKGVSNLINIYSSLSGIGIPQIEEKYKNANYAIFKRDVADLVASTLNKIQNEYNKIINSEVINKILKENKDKVNAIAKEKYQALRELIGLSI